MTISLTNQEHSSDLTILGEWVPSPGWSPAFAQPAIAEHIQHIRQPLYVLQHAANGALGVALGGQLRPLTGDRDAYRLLAMLPAIYPEWLGDRAFLEAHGTRFAYVSGEMANGIATTQMVIHMANAGMLGFFGSAGLHPTRVEQAIDEMESALTPRGLSYGANLIHSPNEPALEDAVVDLFLRRGVRRVSASAFMGMTKSIVRYACSGLRQNEEGRIVRSNHVFAKISRPEVARQFMSPAPDHFLAELVRDGKLTAYEADLARFVPVAQDVTVEGDSGGHTDNRPLVALYPTILALRNELMAKHSYPIPIRLGAAGGLGTPASVAAAFSLGAAYVVTGTVNQSAVESGLSKAGRSMLAEADISDVTMAPAADMFEMGVKVQVLKRGTLFSNRAARLYEIYRTYDGIEEIPEVHKKKLETEIFQASLDDVWQETVAFFQQRDPAQLSLAARSPKHQMALIFRWYLGKASRWAIEGTENRQLDYQIWCGPVMGAFNAWTQNTFLASPERRDVVQIALNLLEGAAVVTRAHQVRASGVPVPQEAFDFKPRPLRV